MRYVGSHTCATVPCAYCEAMRPIEPAAPESVIEEALRLTGGDRQADYGPPEQDYLAVVTAFNAITRRTGDRALSPADGALFMCCVKLAREGHRPKRDNRTDLVGYAWVLDRCREAEK